MLDMLNKPNITLAGNRRSCMWEIHQPRTPSAASRGPGSPPRTRTRTAARGPAALPLQPRRHHQRKKVRYRRALVKVSYLASFRYIMIPNLQQDHRLIVCVDWKRVMSLRTQLHSSCVNNRRIINVMLRWGACLPRFLDYNIDKE